MANSILPDIHIGKSCHGKYRHNKSHSVLTSSGIGFLQPLMCMEITPRTTTTVKLSNYSFMAAMPKPTFGLLTYNCYHQFVSMSELFPPFEKFLSGKRYTSSTLSYIPTKLPNIYQYDLSLLLLGNYNTVTIYSAAPGSSTYTKVSSANAETARGLFYSAFDYQNTAFNVTSGRYALDQNDVTNFGINPIEDVTPEGADYILRTSNGSSSYLYCIRFNTYTRNLFKILVGCGYKVNLRGNRSRSLMKIFAYYKAWYDMFAIQQTSSWTDTNCYKILQWFTESGNNTLSGNMAIAFLNFFRDELPKCYYVDNVDFVSSHITHPAVGTAFSLPSVSSATGFNMENKLVLNNNSQPYLQSNSSLNRNVLLLLNRVAKWVNKDSVIGERLGAWLKAHGMGDLQIKTGSRSIGNDIVTMEISPINNLADTANPVDGSGGYLGETAGKGGFANSGSKKHKFTSDTFGYWVTLATVVPHCGYHQGVEGDCSHVERWDFWTEEFDALGYEITDSETIFADNSVVSVSEKFQPTSSFGFVPRGSSYRYKQNVVNGNAAYRSLRDEYLPYSVDRVFTPSDLKVKPVQGGYNVDFYSHSLPAAGESYRWIGRDDSLGNFNRIFINSSDEGYGRRIIEPMEDNFTIYNAIEVKQISPVKSWSVAYDTDEFNDGMNIEKV